MNELKFNIYGFARPTTKAEVSALLDEAIRVGDEIEAQIDAMSAQLKANAAAKQAVAA